MYGHMNIKFSHICPAELLVQVSFVLRRSQSNTPLTRIYTYNFMTSAKSILCSQIVNSEYGVKIMHQKIIFPLLKTEWWLQ